MSTVMVSVVIPCYYSEKTISAVVDQTRRVLVDAGYDYEFVLVNDGSTDGTFAQIQELCHRDPRVVGVDCAKNMGQHNAIMAGLLRTRGDAVLLMDDDMQTHPTQVTKILQALEESGCDVVFAQWPEHKEALWRRLGSRFQAWTVRVLTKRPKDVYSSNFFAMRRHVRDEVVRYRGPYIYIQGLVFRATDSVCNVEVEHFARQEGRSGYTLKSLVRLWSTVLGFSLAPLRMALWLGMIACALGLIGAVALVVQHFVDPVLVEGWTSLMVLSLVLGGLNLAFLGLIGEYLGRTFMTVSNAPQFALRTVLDARDSKGEDHAA
ncbi:MAG: glycosyltransferase family 2 protein [Eggerthellales bacterium]|nr:glycosyltransferase family 2 protein [Eggerthellales bacterium]